MKRSHIISLSVLGILLVGSLSVNVIQNSTNNHVKTQLEQQENQNKDINQKLSTKSRENKFLKSEVDGFKKFENNKDKSQSELNFDNITNKFLTTMFTFEPDTYNNRKDNLKGLISDNLYNKYFPKNTNYGDANNVSSKLDKATIYTQAKQGNELKGLAVVTFESKSGDNEWKKETDLYQIKFDTTNNQITDVQNLGSSFKASDVE
ncbi:hypothetical protein GHI93_10520 [Lactococcus hircilactis]|uniref:Uncharacterized protein n=1 Tax=Lactococcus hircilactis TaxID=1494462 RepID=A0A7X1ZAL8_9LACT|nr:hypothetical protein [Lactococcus hircilactis]MQW40354.1 hypothetical protein [Lactococcus hircilactis]